MELDDDDARHLIGEAHALIAAAGYASDDERYDQLLAWARENTACLVQAGLPEGLWLECILAEHDRSSLDDAEFTGRFIGILRKAAEAGSNEAKFRLACELDYEPETKPEAVALFAEVATTGHAHAMWCHGLDLLTGTVVEKDPVRGLSYIRKSADLKFEGAIQFISDAYACGTHGYPKDETEAARWRRKLGEKDVIHY